MVSVWIRNEGGKCLGLSDGSRVKLITVDGLAFKDFLGTGELAPYEDWRLHLHSEFRISPAGLFYGRRGTACIIAREGSSCPENSVTG